VAKAKRKSKIEVVAPQVPALVPMGKTVAITIKSGGDDTLTIALSDGAKLVMKPIFLGIERSLSKYNVQGEALYQINAGMAVQVVVPKRLKRKGG
jgi:hypothetical protein